MVEDRFADWDSYDDSIDTGVDNQASSFANPAEADEDDNEDGNASWDLWDAKPKLTEFQKASLFHSFIEKLLGRRSNDPRTVLKWMRDGNKVSIASTSKKLGKNMISSLFQLETPFFLHKGNGRLYYVVGNINRDALKQSLDRTNYERQKSVHIFNYQEFSALVKGDETLKSKNLIHISGLAEYEAELMRRNIASHGRGIKYAMSRMSDGTWMLTFKQDDFVNTNRISSFKNQPLDVITAYTAAMLSSKGPYGEVNAEKMSTELSNERKAVDKFKRLVKKDKDVVFVYDGAQPNGFVKIGNSDIEFYNVQNPFTPEATPILVNSYEKNDPFVNDVYMNTISSYESISYTRSENKMLSEIRDSSAMEMRRGISKELSAAASVEYILASKLVRSFVDTYREYDFMIDSQMKNEIMGRFAKHVSNIANVITTTPIGRISDEGIKDIAQYLQRNQIDIKQYMPALDAINRADIKILAPQEKRISVRKELERIQNEMKYNSQSLDQDISSSREEWYKDMQKKLREDEDID